MPPWISLVPAGADIPRASRSPWRNGGLTQDRKSSHENDLTTKQAKHLRGEDIRVGSRKTVYVILGLAID